MEIVHKKNTAKYLAIPMVDSATPANFKTGVSPVDTAYSKTGAGAWSSLDIADTFSEIASTGVYEIDLTAGELNYDQVFIKAAVSGAADTFVLFVMNTSEIDDLALASACTETRLAELDAGNIPSDVDDILADTNELQTDDVPGLIGALNDISTTEVNTECDTALTDYDPPTKAEMDTGHGLLATEAKQDIIDTNVDSVLTDTGTTLPGTLSTIDGKIDTVDTNVDAVLVDTGTTLPGTLSTINTNVDAILVDTGTTLPGTLTTIDTIVDAIKAATDNLPADPASETNVDANETKIDAIDTVVDAIQAKTDNLPDGITKASATTLLIKMVDETDGYTAETGKTVACQISKDKGAFAACTNTPATEIASGWYYLTLTGTETTADDIVVTFSSAGCRNTELVIKTQT